MTKKVTDKILKEMFELRAKGYSYGKIAKKFNLGRTTIYRNLTPEKKEKRKEYSRKYNKEYRMNNKEKLKINCKKWRKENLDKCREDNKKWREKNPERWREISKRAWKNFYKNSPEKVKEINKRYFKSLKGQTFNKRHNYKRRCKFPLKFNTKDMIYIKERDNNCCVYCGSKNDLTFDHINPNGGTSIDNLVLACRSCNSKKKDRNVFYFCKIMNINPPKIITKLV